MALCGAGVCAVLIGAGVRGSVVRRKQGGDADLLAGHGEGIAGDHLIVRHETAVLQVIARVRRHRQGDGLASGGGGLVSRDRAVGHAGDGDAVALGRRGGLPGREVDIVDGGAGASLGRALKHKGEPGAGDAVTGRDGEAACAGDILGGVVLVDLAHVVLGVPDLRPGLALVQAGLDRQFQLTCGELGIAGGEVEAQLHAVLHGDLRQDQQLVLGGAAHVVRRADRRVAAPILIAGDLPGLVVIIGTGALHSPSSREPVTVVEVLVDAVRQGNCLRREGSRDGVIFGDILKGVLGLLAHGCIVYLNIRDLIALRGSNGKLLTFALSNGYRTVGADAAALTGGGGDGKGLRGGRGSLAAHGGELHVVHKDGAAVLVIRRALITESQHRSAARNLNGHISGSNIAVDNAIGQLIKMLFRIPDLTPVLTVRRCFNGNCHIPVFHVRFAARKLEC